MTARLATHRKFLRLAHAIGPVLARGTLEILWDYCGENADDRLGDAADIEAIAHWAGEAGQLTGDLAAAGFIDLDSDRPGHWKAHDYWEHAPRHNERLRTLIRRGKAGPASPEMTGQDRAKREILEDEPAAPAFHALKSASKKRDPHGNQNSAI